MDTLYHDLVINPMFRDLIPPPTEEERKLLEEGIVANGCHTPIETWDGVIIDGHNRYEICTRLGIPFKTRELTFADDEEAKIYIIANQLGRRNITPAVKGDLAWQRAGLIEARARERSGMRTDLVAERQQGSELGKTTEILAKQTGIPARTLSKIKRVRDSGDENLRDKMLKGEISITAAEREIAKQTEPAKVCKDCGQSEPDAKFSTTGAVCNACRRVREVERANYIPPELEILPPPSKATEALEYDDKQYRQALLTDVINDFLNDSKEFAKPSNLFDGLGRSSELYGLIVKASDRLNKFKQMINGGKS